LSHITGYMNSKLTFKAWQNTMIKLYKAKKTPKTPLLQLNLLLQ